MIWNIILIICVFAVVIWFVTRDDESEHSKDPQYSPQRKEEYKLDINIGKKGGDCDV